MLRVCELKIHNRHHSLSRKAGYQGSINDTDADRIVKRMISLFRICAWQGHSVGHEGEGATREDRVIMGAETSQELAMMQTSRRHS